MTTYWCPWCGAIAYRAGPDERPGCRRCTVELARLFGFIPRTMMVPLDPGQAPPEHGAARKRFVFRDAEGRELGGTEEIPFRQQRRAANGD